MDQTKANSISSRRWRYKQAIELSKQDNMYADAMQTAADPLHRMALVPRVMEARGLDVTPGMIEKFAALGDDETAEVLRIIWRDEITHVAIGTRWFQHLCSQQSLDPETTYFRLLEQYLRNAVRGPFHRKARTQAGSGPEPIPGPSRARARAQAGPGPIQPQISPIRPT